MELILQKVRLAFGDGIWEPKAFKPGDKPRCACNLLFAPNSEPYNQVVAAVKAVATEKWGAKANDVLKTLKAKGDLCLHDGAEKAEYEGFEGNFFVSAANKVRPVVCDRNRAPLTEADGKPYSGCYVNAKIDVWAQDNQYGKRINAKLLVVQFHSDGEAFSGGATGSADDMPDMDANEGTASAGTASAADDIF